MSHFINNKIISWLFTILFILLNIQQIIGWKIQWLFFILPCILLFLVRCRHLNKEYICEYFFIISLFGYVLIAAFLRHKGYGASLTLVSGLMVFATYKNICLSKKQMVCMTLVMFVPLFYWLIRSPFWYNLWEYNRWKGLEELKNPNMVGRVINYTSMLLFAFLENAKKQWIKKGRWILLFLGIWGTYNVRARMSMVVSCCFLLGACLMNIKIFTNALKIKTAFLLSVLLEGLFPLVYLTMYKIGFGVGWKFAGTSAKGLYSGRQEIWMNAFEAMTGAKEIFLGMGSENDFWVGHSLNMHSNFMNLLVVYGVIILILYWGYLGYLFFRKYDYKHSTKMQDLLLLFFICVLVEGTTEITIFYNEFILYTFMPLGMAFNKKFVFRDKLNG